jgi:hypothetical protein
MPLSSRLLPRLRARVEMCFTLFYATLRLRGQERFALPSAWLRVKIEVKGNGGIAYP